MSKNTAIAHLRALIIADAAAKKKRVTTQELEDFTLQGLVSTCHNRGIIIPDERLSALLAAEYSHVDTGRHLDVRIIEKVPSIFRFYRVAFFAVSLALLLYILMRR